MLAPGTVAVSAPPDGSRPATAPDVGVELILDTSGSMLETIEGRRCIDVARDARRSLVTDGLDEGVPVALRTFGGKGKGRKVRCQTQLTLPLTPLDREAALGCISGLEARKRASTPLGAALLAVAEDLAGATRPRTVVLITDGEETCKGDPAEAIETLRAGGLDVHVNIVGFALDDESPKESLVSWAGLGRPGRRDVLRRHDRGDPRAAIAPAVNAPFRILGPSGEVLASGTVGGAPVSVEPGTYVVEVLVDAPVTYREVVVTGGQAVDLVLPPAGVEP